MSSSSSTISTSLFLLGLVGVILAASITKPEKQLDNECSSNDDCQDDHCCIIAPVRYSVPRCLPKSGKGDHCRLESEKINTTLFYTHDRSVELRDVFYVICPCKNDLTCDLKEHVCV